MRKQHDFSNQKNKVNKNIVIPRAVVHRFKKIVINNKSDLKSPELYFIYKNEYKTKIRSLKPGVREQIGLSFQMTSYSKENEIQLDSNYQLKQSKKLVMNYDSNNNTKQYVELIDDLKEWDFSIIYLDILNIDKYGIISFELYKETEFDQLAKMGVTTDGVNKLGKIFSGYKILHYFWIGGLTIALFVGIIHFIISMFIK